MRLCTVVIVLFAALVPAACDSYETNANQSPSRTLTEIEDSGKLIVATRNAPTTYYIDRGGEPAGPEYDLITAFAEWLGGDVEFVMRPSVSAVLEAVEHAEADLATAGLTITEP